MKMKAEMASTRTDELTIDSADGEAGSNIDRFLTDGAVLAQGNGRTTVTPFLPRGLRGNCRLGACEMRSSDKIVSSAGK
jgi:hypothetical protein